MSASALSSPTTFTGGLRRVRLHQDLGAIADLIELSFAATMDVSGKAAVQEMRGLSKLGLLLPLVAMLDRGIRSMGQGFVWIDPATGNLIGNTSVFPAGHDNLWAIANVAVHPAFRRQGIAQELMDTTLEWLKGIKAAGAVLQVEADNYAAIHLYEKLGFETLRNFKRWRRDLYRETPKRLPDAPAVNLRRGREWQQHYALAEQLRPNALGGMGWLRPTQPLLFRKKLWRRLLEGVAVDRKVRWAIREQGELVATLDFDLGFGVRYCRADMLVRPDRQGQLEKPLLNFVLRFLADFGRSLTTDHPADDEAATEAFRAYQFDLKRHLTHMIWRVP